MTKSKSSASSIVVPTIFVIHLMNGAQFLNVTYVTRYPIILILPLTKMSESLSSKRLDFKTSVL